ncbi:MAG: bifunctional ADP-dependent NAD(P)H-hydrate dehydratase/NAD(P)H-hydrate epimerase [Flavobacterium sp.]|nr:MAG: bifunctional ADP-dependent NAD(P)H-hydrate dehydratase/NAD(P)H-hydrate epimerase [Flavobacterium sp.]
MKVLSTEQFYQADKVTIKTQKLKSIDLMERAAEQCFNWFDTNLKGSPVPIHVFCGIGNNGGDGLALGRMLIKHGYNVTVYIANFTDKRSPDFLSNYNLIREVSEDWPILMTSEEDFPEINKEDIIVDALFGIGLNRPPEGWVKKLIQYLNELKAFKLAIDIPSGLYPEKTIEDEEAVFKANHTLTFQNPKLALFLPENANYSQTFDILDIGLDTNFINEQEPLAIIIGKFEAQNIYKPRNKFAHKGKFGHSLLIGGSYGKIGAITLATKAAIKVGAGLVTAMIPKCGYAIIQTSIPEAMVITDASENIITQIEPSFNPSVIAIGPGLGTDKKTITALRKFIKENKEIPLVLDADALNCISEDKSLLKLLPKNSILTPHPGELKRLIGEWKNDYHKIELTKKFSITNKVIVLIKGANTMIINGTEVYINQNGNPGMATAGSGDVLAGMITGLVSQGYDSLEATLFGVYLHGSAGDIASSYLGFEALIASNIIDNIGNAFQELFKSDASPQIEN